MNHKMEISLLVCADIDRKTRSEVEEVFRQSFMVRGGAGHVLDAYFRGIQCVLIARDRYNGSLIGFQFYQEVRLNGRIIHHFSLSGRKDGFRGVQHEFGKHVLLHALIATVPWKSVYLAGVTNDPRSYKNMHVIGGRSFPNVHGKSENCFGEWYFNVAGRLGIEGVDGRGLVHDRMRKIGFGLREYKVRSSSPLVKAYDDYVGGSRETGVFCLVELVPLRDVPVYFFRQVMSVFGRGSRW